MLAVELKSLRGLIDSVNAELRPMHPNTDDNELLCYFVLEVKSSVPDQEIIDNLLRLKCVDAAYIKPHDEMP